MSCCVKEVCVACQYPVLFSIVVAAPFNSQAATLHARLARPLEAKQDAGVYRGGVIFQTPRREEKGEPVLLINKSHDSIIRCARSFRLNLRAGTHYSAQTDCCEQQLQQHNIFVKDTEYYNRLLAAV